MEQVIMVEVLYFSKWQKEKTHAALMAFKRAAAWVSRGS